VGRRRKKFENIDYKRDVARACVETAEKKQNKTEIFNLAAEPVKMKDFVNEIAGRLNKKVFPISLPTFLLRAIFRANSKTFKLRKLNKASETVEKWLSDDVIQPIRLRKLTGSKRETPIFEAVNRQIDYYQANKK
jgi:nucleoside-diphosphate-sugar epimerase